MSVRDSLLAALLPGPAYGFQLHREITQRVGERREVNVGQTYATLDRLTRQKLIEPAGSTDDGLPLHRLTPSGRAAVEQWFAGTDAAGADASDETVERVLVALSLAEVDAPAVIAAETSRWAARPRDRRPADSPLAALAARADAARTERMLEWLADAARLAEERERFVVERSNERPRRGRRPAA
ncbi:PadR family transcriptional regulator [Agromyces atrinae]|uniref:PadR family transcriptional regulator n=1 Tax=Agromyces atrinae TaxID=592376 RepID=UPI001F59B1CD|nr:helix-turn-helix transcriptional regulator [Agromyces atrinae]MCI2958738.1 PadR family transcriptional regulator [Agromyces atrinae]